MVWAPLHCLSARKKEANASLLDRDQTGGGEHCLPLQTSVQGPRIKLLTLWVTVGFYREFIRKIRTRNNDNNYKNSSKHFC